MKRFKYISGLIAILFLTGCMGVGLGDYSVKVSDNTMISRSSAEKFGYQYWNNELQLPGDDIILDLISEVNWDDAYLIAKTRKTFEEDFDDLETSTPKYWIYEFESANLEEFKSKKAFLKKKKAYGIKMDLIDIDKKMWDAERIY